MESATPRPASEALMPAIHVTTREGQQNTVELTIGLSLMQAIRHAGLDEMLALCGGNCSCATCHVYVDPASVSKLPPMLDDEDDLLDGSGHRRALSRLSCQIPLAAGLDGVRVTIAPAG